MRDRRSPRGVRELSGKLPSMKTASSRERKSRRYRVVLYRDEDGVHVAECPILHGCVSQGRSRAAALRNIKDAISGYVASLRKHGDPIPPAKDETVVEVAV